MKNKKLIALSFVCTFALVQSVVAAVAPDNVKQETVQKLKSKEKSPANKILDSASMATVGVGAMQAASALSEKNADDDAEQDMRMYLATFRCDYGQGRNIRGGETNIQLPGVSELAQFVAEYKQLAANLKSDKAALGMQPGIEADVKFDSANTGLYDDVSIGRADGAFTSLSRALLDESSADAAAWQAQKDTSAEKLKTGVTVAGAGVVASIAGNALIQAAGDGKLKNIFGRGGFGQGGVLVDGGHSTPDAGAGVFGGDASNELDAEIRRAIAATDALRSEISAQADSLYNDILSVQSDAQAAEIDVTPIEVAVTSVDAAKTAISDAMTAAGNAVAAAQKLTMPDAPECTAEKPEAPNKEDYKNTEPDENGAEYDEEGYASAQDEYKSALKEYESALNNCKKAEDTYNKEVKKVVADAKRHADEAERQLNIGRTELNRIQTALSNAQAAKTRGEDAKKAAAAKEEAEQEKEAELQQQIADRVAQVRGIAERARTHNDDARNIYNQITGLVVLDESESAAEEQITILKESATDDIDKAKTATESAEKQVQNATKAGTVAEADAAIAEAQRQEEIVQGRKQALTDTLQKIQDVKRVARENYLKAQSQENSEESEEYVEESENE